MYSIFSTMYSRTYKTGTKGRKFLVKVTDHMPILCIIEDTYQVK